MGSEVGDRRRVRIERAQSSDYLNPPGDVDLDGLRRVWGGRIDTGAHEYGSFRYGDLNCDGLISFRDINLFVALLSGQ